MIAQKAETTWSRPERIVRIESTGIERWKYIKIRVCI
jgi:hypothetical protein